MNKNIHYVAGLAASVTLAVSAHGALAAEKSPWETTGAAGVSMNRGNSDTLSYTLQLLSTYEHGSTEAVLGADYLYADNEGVKATDTLRIFGEYRHLVDDRFYLGLNGSFMTDSIADIDYRIDVAAVAGYYLLKNDRTKWSAEIGPGYAWEKQGGITDSYLTLRIASRLEHQLSARSKFWLSAAYLPQIDDYGDYLLNLTAGIDTVLTDHWALRTAVRYQYDSTPAANRQAEDTLLTFGLRYSLAGFPEPEADGRRSLKPTAAAPEAVQMGWTSTAALTLSLAEGNADSLTAGVSYESAYREEGRELFLDLAYAYAEVAGVRSADALFANAQLNRLITERSFIGMSLGYQRDEIADVDYRFTPAVTYGYYLVKKDNMTLSVEAGPGYVFEEVGGVRDDYFSIFAAEKFVWQVNERMAVKQSVVAQVNPSDAEDFNLLADVSFDTDITTNLAWRVGAAWAYDNTPAEARDSDDFTLFSGIAVQF